jgi:hypothetical protein
MGAFRFIVIRAEAWELSNWVTEVTACADALAADHWQLAAVLKSFA